MTHRRRNLRRGLLGAAVFATCIVVPVLAGAPPLSALSADDIGRSALHDHSPFPEWTDRQTPLWGDPEWADPEHEAKPEPDYPTTPPWLKWKPGSSAEFPPWVKPKPGDPPKTGHQKDPPEKPKPVTPTPQPSPSQAPLPRPPRPRPHVPAPPAVLAPKTPTPTPTPSRTHTPRPALATSTPFPLRQRLVLDRYAERREGTDRRLVLLVMFTGVISVTAVTALNHRPRR